MSSTFRDYYQSPPALCRFEVSTGENVNAGFFRFGQDLCYGRNRSSMLGDCNSVQREPQADGAVSAPSGIVRLPFDPDEVTDNFRLERYIDNSSGGVAHSLMKWSYYGLRPLLPVSLRKHLQRFHLRNRRTGSFPQWPIDDSADRLQRALMLLALEASGCSEIPFVWFWPCGYDACVIMTHDVEEESGRAFCAELMDMDEAHGIPSSFQLVPEGRYTVTPEFRDELRKRGFELNIHDVSHKCDLFSDYDTFSYNAEKINQYAKVWGAEGFRAAAMYRKQAWLPKLQVQYDMSVPNAAHLEPQPGGCCTLLPYFVGHLVELPLTMTQDYTLFHILNRYSIDLWRQEIEFAAARRGLISFIVHPDYVIERKARNVYVKLLQHLAALRQGGRIWFAQPREVAHWWRQRTAMRVVKDGQGYTIEGDSSGQARLASATRGPQGLVFKKEDVAKSGTTGNGLAKHRA